jgi:RNA-directed DNA polymerase
MAFTSLNHYLDAEWLRYAYECTRKDGAVGADGQTAQEYAADLEQNVRKYFDSIDHAKLRELLVRRVTDGVVRRMSRGRYPSPASVRLRAV